MDISRVQLDVKKELAEIKYHIDNNILTLRDAKRFLNSFHNQFSLVKDILVFKDYFLLSLIKYKYYDIYLTIQKEMFPSLQYVDLNAIHNKLFNDIDFRLNSLLKKIVLKHFDNDNHCCEDKEELSEDRLKKVIESKIDDNILSILRSLFNSTNVENSNSIGNSDMFDFYFDENDNIEDYSNTAVYYKFLFDKEISIIKENVDEYFRKNETEKLLEFISKRRLEILSGNQSFRKYVDILFYINIISGNEEHTRSKLMSVCTKSFVENLTEVKVIDDVEEHKEYLKSKFQCLIPFYPYLFYRDLIVNTIRDRDNQLYIFNKEEVLIIAKSNLDEYISENTVYDKNHYQLLLSCIDDLRGEYEEIMLDEESCRKVEKLIKENPDEYLLSFVRLGMISRNLEWNTITCDPFWKQIFITENNFKSLIFNERLNEKPYIIKVRNFWHLFKNNGFKPIEYRDDGVVIEKINNDLQEEFEEFDSIKVSLIEALLNESHMQWGELLQDTNPGNYGVEDIEVEINDSDIIFINAMTEKFAISNVNLYFTARLGSSGDDGIDYQSSASVDIEGGFTINNEGKITIQNISTNSFIDLFFDDNDQD